MARRKDGWDYAYVIATVALVFVGACGVRYAIRTLKAIELQSGILSKSVEAAEKNADAAKENAEAAKDTVAAMHEANRNNLISLRAVQRPYVAPHLADMAEWNVGAFRKEAGLDHWQFQFPIKNSGNTPAIAVSAHTNIHTFPADSGMPPDFDYPNYGTVGGHFPDFLAAGGKTYGQFKIPHNFVRDIYENKRVFYFYGWIEYRDVFQRADETPHRTEYCYQMKIIQIAEPKLMFNLARHREHNKQT